MAAWNAARIKPVARAAVCKRAAHEATHGVVESLCPRAARLADQAIVPARRTRRRRARTSAFRRYPMVGIARPGQRARHPAVAPRKPRSANAGFSTMNSDRPRCGGCASASVRASTRSVPAMPRERAPRLATAKHPIHPAGRGLGAQLYGRHIGSGGGFGDRDGTQRLAGLPRPVTSARAVPRCRPPTARVPKSRVA